MKSDRQEKKQKTRQKVRKVGQNSRKLVMDYTRKCANNVCSKELGKKVCKKVARNYATKYARKVAINYLKGVKYI